ncbi:pyrroline-5-carboxylate reductase [Pelagicoccus mobilis]|uniref:Pyrroline-5-carboxylate reductase n=1 Tax=Pelagicoccus mobilis TaxID=415221 RepID=A0A934S247_9BACT|nr:pyrroline-5-carboxylate reductase [Pelagicoccus mobilis]MBK1878034.1 pyrroline-5-carboxylate reductase [Pelagicoccus mobilis]
MKIGFIGAGNMARAIATGLVNSGLAPQNISCISGDDPTAANLAKDLGANLAANREELISFGDIVLLAFKPNHLETITPEEGDFAEGKVVLSILAGRTLADLAKAFPKAANIVRVMPNTPAAIGAGVATYCFQNEPSDELKANVEKILGALGTAYQVVEEQLHIATVINGCGPAFYFRIVQLLGEIAEKHGLDKNLAMTLASETAIGSCQLFNQSDKSAQELIDAVTSPNGVTHALLQSLDRNGFPNVLEVSAQDAVDRSVELSEG